VTVVAALLVLVAVLLAVNLALSAGIIRRLRAGESAHGLPDQRLPAVGNTMDLDRDGAPWPESAGGMTRDVAVAALVMPGCPGCDRLHHELDDAGGLPVPLYVIGDPAFGEENDAYLASWTGARTLIAPVSSADLVSFDRPDAFPTVVLLEDGAVRAAGHRLSDVAPALRTLLDRRGAARAGI
jgi:hypothetical protein